VRWRDGHDTPVEVNTLAAEHAADEIERLPDVTEFAEAEALAIHGPPDGANELTPTRPVEDACGFCLLVTMQRCANFTPHPHSCSEAWHMRTCCGTWDGRWAWCQIRGLLAVDGVVTDCNRRTAPRGGPPPGTPERRRPR